MTVYIRDAVRTPRAKARPEGSLASQTPHGLLAGLVAALDARGGDTTSVEALMIGCVGQVGAQGGNIAEVAKLASDLPDRATAQTINAYCASGLMAVGQGAALIETGCARELLAGGVEMMSQVPFMADKATYYDDAGFDPPARYVPVALAADRLASRLDIGRELLDEVALASQTKSAAAERDAALNASRVAVGSLDRDECVRASIDSASLAAMEPAFADLRQAYEEALGDDAFPSSLTLAHAPPMCDGAGLALLTGEATGARARILSYAQAGGDVGDSLLAGFDAMQVALDRAGLALEDMAAIEFMEAFAVVIAKFLRDHPQVTDRVNIGGGHLAKGHPMGATGTILLSTLLDALDARDGRHGLVVVTGAAGIGAAMVVERLVP